MYRVLKCQAQLGIIAELIEANGGEINIYDLRQKINNIYRPGMNMRELSKKFSCNRGIFVREGDIVRMKE